MFKGGHARTGQEGHEEEYRYSSTVSLTSALDEGGIVNATPRQLYPRERDPILVLQEVGLASGLIWTCAENLAGIRLPDFPARSESVVSTELSERRETVGSNSDEVWRSAQIGQFITGSMKENTASFLRNNEIMRKLEF